ncbi:hypothetical protein CPB84DRAFT_1753122 [Gymnopilus junonius]|uniref:FCP1 homology domain-containing protein n=1 Tax=Gymnopilus junonius TaxID=109634 RepID=A0A9P5N9B4_GYMJU|nr:hypothetical protein CPB84DRAFT_1753122 [Gymnopilus junonius]
MSNTAHNQRMDCVNLIQKLSVLPQWPQIPQITDGGREGNAEVRGKSWVAEENHTQHSAKSTLLVDDSLLKVILQPWNHLDLRPRVHPRTALDGSGNCGLGVGAKGAGEGGADEGEEGGEREGEREEDVGGGEVQGQPKEYDAALLVVIGILDHLKYENNMAGWMRTGGLLGVPAGAGALEEGEIHSATTAAAAASEDNLLKGGAGDAVGGAELDGENHRYLQHTRLGGLPKVAAGSGGEGGTRGSMPSGAVGGVILKCGPNALPSQPAWLVARQLMAHH